MKRIQPKVVSPLKQFGSLWVETIETFDPEANTTRRYDYIWMRHRIVKDRSKATVRERIDAARMQLGTIELRLARIVEKPLPG